MKLTVAFERVSTLNMDTYSKHVSLEPTDVPPIDLDHLQ